jgi:hypothetical protein
MDTTWKCGHNYTPAAPDFDPVGDADWCAKHDCPPCRKAQAKAADEKRIADAAYWDEAFAKRDAEFARQGIPGF